MGHIGMVLSCIDMVLLFGRRNIMGFDGLDWNSMVYMEDGRKGGWDGKSICAELCRGPEYSITKLVNTIKHYQTLWI